MCQTYLTYEIVKTKLIRELDRENTAKSHMIKAAFLLATKKTESVSLRSILKIAGYASSKFYRYWGGRDDFILDAYLHCVERYIDAEVATAREFSGGSPRDYFECIAQHTVLSQKHLHGSFFKEIAGEIAGGNYSRLLVHMEDQVKRNMNVFFEKFPCYEVDMDFERERPKFWAVGTFILTRNYDDGLKTITDDDLVRMIADTYEGLIQSHKAEPETL